MYGGSKDRLIALRNSGKATRRDIYGLRIKQTPKERLDHLVREFEYPGEKVREAKEAQEEFKKIVEIHKEREEPIDFNDPYIKDLRTVVNDFKREWMNRYSYYKLEFEILMDEIEYTRNRGNRLISTITGMPSGSHNSKPEDEWADIIEFTDLTLDYLNTIAEKCLYTLLDIEELIQGIDDPEIQMILNYRYIRGMSVQEIMDTTHYSRTHIWKIETKGLDLLEIDFNQKEELEKRMEKEYRRFEFEQDHFDPDVVDPEILEEYIDELKHDRDEAQKIIDKNRNRRKGRQKDRERYYKKLEEKTMRKELEERSRKYKETEEK